MMASCQAERCISSVTALSQDVGFSAGAPWVPRPGLAGADQPSDRQGSRMHEDKGARSRDSARFRRVAFGGIQVARAPAILCQVSESNGQFYEVITFTEGRDRVCEV